jgi:hypothetical protein
MRAKVPLQLDIVATYAFAGSSVSEPTTVDVRPYNWLAVEHHSIAEELELLHPIVERVHQTRPNGLKEVLEELREPDASPQGVPQETSRGERAAG